MKKEERIEVAKIEIKIDGQTVSIKPERARELHRILGELLGLDKPEVHYYPQNPVYIYPQRPTWSPFWYGTTTWTGTATSGSSFNSTNYTLTLSN